MNADIRSINKLSWHLDFRQAETEIVKNKDCATKVVKLLKYFRNCNPPFHAIFKSYFLKTLVMTIMIKKDPFRSWQDYDLCKNFLDALTKLREYCKIIGFNEISILSRPSIYETTHKGTQILFLNE